MPVCKENGGRRICDRKYLELEAPAVVDVLAVLKKTAERKKRIRAYAPREESPIKIKLDSRWIWLVMIF